MQVDKSEYIELSGPVIDLNCGDGREPTDTTVGPYAKVFGGRPALAWNAMALQELTNSGTVQKSLVDTDAEFAEHGLYKKAGINGGVHSDEHCEGDGALKIDTSETEGQIGCGRWEKGAEIARAALDNIVTIIEEVKHEAPGAIEGLEDQAHSLAKANAMLAERQLPDGTPILPPGRKVVVGAIKNGAKEVVLKGKHVEEIAEYCVKSGETNDTRVTQRRFEADGWANSRFFESNKDVFPYDPRLVVLQDVIMAKATKLVLAGSSKVDKVRS